MFRKTWKSGVRLDGKTAIITGCNSGIGKYNAFDFYIRGCRVIMACRDLAKAEQAKQDIIEEAKEADNVGSLLVEKLDLASLTSVRNFARNILEKEYKVHILVNNAGVMGAEKTLTEDGYELHFATNHLGHFFLTVLLIHRLIESAPARIVNVSSLAHAIGRINFSDINSERTYSSSLAYAQSKLANILFTRELARRLRGKSVNVYAVHPGAGAQTQLYCSLDEKAGKETGLYYSNCRVATPSQRARDMETARKLWDLSLSMVGFPGIDPLKRELIPRGKAREKKVISFSPADEEEQSIYDE